VKAVGAAGDQSQLGVDLLDAGDNREVRVVLRVGDGEVANETRSLLPLGLVRDVHRIAAALLAAMAVGEEAEGVVCLGDDAHLRFPDGRDTLRVVMPQLGRRGCWLALPVTDDRIGDRGRGARLAQPRVLSDEHEQSAPRSRSMLVCATSERRVTLLCAPALDEKKQSRRQVVGSRIAQNHVLPEGLP